MTQADVKLAAYEECLTIAREVERTFGAMPAAACQVIAARIRALMEQIASE